MAAMPSVEQHMHVHSTRANTIIRQNTAFGVLSVMALLRFAADEAAPPKTILLMTLYEKTLWGGG